MIAELPPQRHNVLVCLPEQVITFTPIGKTDSPRVIILAPGLSHVHNDRNRFVQHACVVRNAPAPQCGANTISLQFDQMSRGTVSQVSPNPQSQFRACKRAEEISAICSTCSIGSALKGTLST